MALRNSVQNEEIDKEVFKRFEVHVCGVLSWLSFESTF